MSDAVAIYWDFENVHAALIEDRHGPGYYRNNRFRPQESVIDVGAVVGYAATIGDVVVNRAYGNWQWFSRYRDELLSNAVELIQIFPAGGHGKNGADIRLVLDALDHLLRFDHITHVMVVGGDSDFIGLAERCRRLGRTMIGVGVEGSVNHYWIKSCSEFKYYKTLLSKTANRAAEILDELREDADVDEVRLLFARAISNLAGREGGGEGVVKAAIKPMMMRLDPTFDEANYGFSSFEDLLTSCKDLAEVAKGTYDHLYSLTDRGKSLATGKKLVVTPSENAEPSQAMHAWSPDSSNEAADYAKILKRGKIRLLTPEFRDIALEAVFEIFNADPDRRLASFDAFMKSLTQELRKNSVPHNRRDLNILRQMLFRFRLFDLLKEEGEDAGIKLPHSLDSATALRREVLRKTADWIATYSATPVELQGLAEVLCGQTYSEEDLAMAREFLESQESLD